MQFLSSIFQQQTAVFLFRYGIACEQKQSYRQAASFFNRAIAQGYFRAWCKSGRFWVTLARQIRPSQR